MGLCIVCISEIFGFKNLSAWKLQLIAPLNDSTIIRISLSITVKIYSVLSPVISSLLVDSTAEYLLFQ